MSVEVEGVKGISGRDKVCTLQPFIIVEIIPDDDVQEDPVAPTPTEPEFDPIDELLDQLIEVIQDFKNNK